MIYYHFNQRLALLYQRDLRSFIIPIYTLKSHLIHDRLDQLITIFKTLLLLILSILKHTYELGIRINPNKILSLHGNWSLDILNLENSVADTHQIQDCVIVFHYRLR